MQLIIKKPTLKTFLNQKLRIPQRINPTNLTSGVMTLQTTFKNKQIIEVHSEIKIRFEQKI